MFLFVHFILIVQLNTFQCILTTDGVQSFAIFLYSEIQWVLEYDPSSPARVGFSDGNLCMYQLLSLCLIV